MDLYLEYLFSRKSFIEETQKTTLYLIRNLRIGLEDRSEFYSSFYNDPQVQLTRYVKTLENYKRKKEVIIKFIKIRIDEILSNTLDVFKTTSYGSITPCDVINIMRIFIVPDIDE